MKAVKKTASRKGTKYICRVCGLTLTMDRVRKTSITEMKHAEAIAKRLNYLGGKPTTKPEPINVGETLKEMLEQDKKDEEGAISLYKKVIELARKEGDETTRKLFVGILADEEEHHDTFTGLLEEI